MTSKNAFRYMENNNENKSGCYFWGVIFLLIITLVITCDRLITLERKLNYNPLMEVIHTDSSIIYQYKKGSDTVFKPYYIFQNDTIHY